MKNTVFQSAYDHPLEVDPKSGAVMKLAAYLPGVAYPDVPADVVKAAKDRGINVEPVSAADAKELAAGSDAQV